MGACLSEKLNQARMCLVDLECAKGLRLHVMLKDALQGDFARVALRPEEGRHGSRFRQAEMPEAIATALRDGIKEGALKGLLGCTVRS